MLTTFIDEIACEEIAPFMPTPEELAESFPPEDLGIFPSAPERCDYVIVNEECEIVMEVNYSQSHCFFGGTKMFADGAWGEYAFSKGLMIVRADKFYALIKP